MCKIKHTLKRTKKKRYEIENYKSQFIKQKAILKARMTVN